MNVKKRLIFPYLVWVIGFTVIPLLVILYYGFTNDANSFTLNNIMSIATYENMRALGLSFLLSITSTIICFILAYPLAYIISFSKLRNKELMIFIFVLPMWMNSLLRTLAWQTILENNGIINSILEFLSLSKVKLINTNGAIIMGMVYNFFPFMILPIFNSIEKIEKDVVNAAYDLGASKIYIFRKILLPLSKPGIVSGIIMVFIPALTTFVISDLLGGGKILLIGNVIEQEFKLNNNWHVGSGLSVVLMIFVIITVALSSDRDSDGNANEI